jgi:DNA gyrase/topoisomerase IV subunit B
MAVKPYMLAMASTEDNTPATAADRNALDSGKNQNSYGADSIKVLKGLDAVRKRPGMYIGDTDDGSGLHHMVFEVSDNAIDEALAGHCDLVLIELNADGSVSVEDNGRGIPTGIHAEEGVSAAEVIMTQLHAGGKFENTSDDNAYKVSGGLHGVGVSVVHALSEWLELTIWREGKEHWMKFAHGDAVAPLEVRGPAPKVSDNPDDNGFKKGTRVTFLASTETFKNVTEFDFDKLEHRYRELAFLNSGVRIKLRDKRHEEAVEHDLYYEGGIGAFVKYLDRNKQALMPEPIAIGADKDGIGMEVALEWNDSYYENVLCFTNNIPQRDGGTHLAAFRAALTRTLNGYAERSGLLKKEKVSLSGDDMREGLTAIVSVKLPDPKFSSQTKDKLVSSEVRQPLESLMADRIISSKEVGTLIQAMGTGIRDEFNLEKLRYHKIVIMTDADVDGAHIRTLLLTFFHRQMPDIIRSGHLFIAQPPLYKVAKGRSEVYLKDNPALDRYLVEAGLSGRVLETEGGARTGADLEALVEHAIRMRNIMGFVPRRFDPVIIEALAIAGAFAPDLSAADRTSALNRATQWLDLGDPEARWSARLTEAGNLEIERLWRGVTDHHKIEAGFLASAEARKLAKLAVENSEVYSATARFVRATAAAVEAEATDGDDEAPATRPTAGGDIISRPSQLLEAVLAAGRKGLSIQRYKGLGEMNAEQLWETTLDPENRALLQVKVEDADVTDEIFTRLMGDVVEPRRDFIQENALNVANLDV